MTRFFAALALAASALFAAGAAEAKAPLPEGSYLDSCRDLYIEGSTLYGECQNNAGKWKKTWISNYGYCDGDIYNNNGVLDCRGGRTPAVEAAPSKPAGGLPGGPWSKTCRDPALDGSIMRANCKDNRGTWRPTWIDLRQCPSRNIGNDDGLLVCLAAAEPPAPTLVPMRDTLPRGSWVDSCRSGVVKQYQMRAECYRDSDGKWLISDLNLKTCKRGGVANRGGTLACE